MSIVAKNVRPMSNDVHSMSNDVNIDVQRSPGSVYLELIQYHFVNKSLIKIGIISTPIFVKHKRYPSPLSQVAGKARVLLVSLPVLYKYQSEAHRLILDDWHWCSKVALVSSGQGWRN